MDYREISEDRILKFSATPAFKGWKNYFTEDSITHPAKMNLNLLCWILETYTSEGDVVLDPMAGTGSTIILASLLGRHGIAVEYESKFCDMIRANIKLTERQTTLTPKGRMTCIKGDARELSKLLKESDAIVTSPPYSESTADTDRPAKHTEEYIQEWGKKKLYGSYSNSENNIGNLKYGDIKAIITSPPYSGTLSKDEGGHTEDRYKEGQKNLGMEKRLPIPYSASRGNIGNLPHGDIDAVVTSPPYESTQVIQDFEAVKIANLRRGRKLSDIESWSIKDEGYGSSPSNIGNLKSNNYLEAMLQVYHESHKVLKPEGIMVLVTKNFIRDKAVVRLDLDTIKLCEETGFVLQDRWYFRLPQKSFWRLLYSRKYPSVPQINYEDVLVFTKGANSVR